MNKELKRYNVSFQIDIPESFMGEIIKRIDNDEESFNKLLMITSEIDYEYKILDIYHEYGFKYPVDFIHKKYVEYVKGIANATKVIDCRNLRKIQKKLLVWLHTDGNIAHAVMKYKQNKPGNWKNCKNKIVGVICEILNNFDSCQIFIKHFDISAISDLIKEYNKLFRVKVDFITKKIKLFRYNISKLNINSPDKFLYYINRDYFTIFKFVKWYKLHKNYIDNSDEIFESVIRDMKFTRL